MQEQEFVCFCLNKRHPNIFMGRRLPSNCRYCNAQFDLMSIIPKAEAEAKGLLKMPEEAAPQPEETPAPQAPAAPAPQQPAAPAGFGFGRPAAPAPQQPAAPTGFGFGRPAAPAPQQPAAPTGFGFGRPAAPAPQQPAAPTGFGFGAAPTPQQPASFSARFAQQPTAMHTPCAETYQLDFFGEKISLPQEGGWLGRSALGAQWFKGNLLISREHVKVVPMANGSVQVGPDKSLNGVSVTVGGVKKTLERNETAVLSVGDTLWLYNIPLQLERK